MGSRVTQSGSAAGERVEVAESGSSGVEGPEQCCDTSPDHSDSIVPAPSNHTQANPASQAGKSVGMPSLRGRRRILIVDDEVAIADTLALIFRVQHYQVQVAYTAE